MLTQTRNSNLRRSKFKCPSCQAWSSLWHDWKVGEPLRHKVQWKDTGWFRCASLQRDPGERLHSTPTSTHHALPHHTPENNGSKPWTDTSKTMSQINYLPPLRLSISVMHQPANTLSVQIYYLQACRTQWAYAKNRNKQTKELTNKKRKTLNVTKWNILKGKLS